MLDPRVKFSAYWQMNGLSGPDLDYEYLNEDHTMLSLHPIDFNARNDAAKLYFTYMVDMSETDTLNAGAVRITLPKYIFESWRGDPILTLDEKMISIPKEATPEDGTYNWTYDGDNVVITNYRDLTGQFTLTATLNYKLSSGNSGSLNSMYNISGGGPRNEDGSYVTENEDPEDGSITPFWHKDYTINLNIKDNDGNTIHDESEQLYAEMHTKVKHTDVMEPFPDANGGVYLKYYDIWGTNNKPEKPDDYFYIVWEYTQTRSTSSTQPWTVEVENDSSDSGDIVGIWERNSSSKGWVSVYHLAHNSDGNTCYYTMGDKIANLWDSPLPMATEKGWVDNFYGTNMNFVVLKKYPKSLLATAFNEDTGNIMNP